MLTPLFWFLLKYIHRLGAFPAVTERDCAMTIFDPHADTIPHVPPLLDIRNLSIHFPSVGRALPSTRSARSGQAPPDPMRAAKSKLAAVRDLTLTVAPGEVLGLVGESGSGKSITALAIMGLLPPAATVSGEIIFQSREGRAASLLQLPPDDLRELRGSHIAMIFQEPMTALNPVMRVGDQIAEAVLAHSRLPKAEAWQRAVEGMRDVAIADPEQRARSYPHQLSGGMRQRVMIAMAIVNRPQLLIADEPTTALDVTIQAQILDLLNDLRHKFGLAMLFISHDLAVVSHVADRVAVMYAGSVVELAARADIFAAPAHPYTQGLLRAIPTLATDRAQPLATIEGSVPTLATLPPGCPFEPRCSHRIAACSAHLPPLIEVSPGHLARCPVINPRP
jgi:peptide/nickel transport system ATP-binding protein